MDKDMERLMDELNKRGIKYTVNGLPGCIYINGKAKEDYTPYMRVSHYEGQKGYYVRESGVICEDVPFDMCVKAIVDLVETGETDI